MAEAAQRAGGRLELLWGSTLYHKDDLPFAEGLRDMPDMFTPFKDKVRGRARRRVGVWGWGWGGVGGGGACWLRRFLAGGFADGLGPPSHQTLDWLAARLLGEDLAARCGYTACLARRLRAPTKNPVGGIACPACPPAPLTRMLAAQRVQCENRSCVRPCLPAPARGALPLPAALDAALLAYQPSRVEDLSALLPPGMAPLATPARDSRVSPLGGAVARPLLGGVGGGVLGGAGRRRCRCRATV